MGMQLGLRDLVAQQCDEYGSAPRVLSSPVNLIDQEERVRSFWMTETLDSSSTIGAAWNIGLARLRPTDLLPCSDGIWDYPEHNMGLNLNASGAFSTYVSLVTRELWHVHDFLQQAMDTKSATDRAHWQKQCREVDERLLKWKADHANLLEEAVRPVSHDGRIKTYDPNVTITRCTFNAYVSSLSC